MLESLGADQKQIQSSSSIRHVKSVTDLLYGKGGRRWLLS